MKRLLMITTVALMLVGAVDANATCWTCKIHFGVFYCAGVAGGDTDCWSTGVDCDTSGIPCIVQSSEAPLASELTVASVERL